MGTAGERAVQNQEKEGGTGGIERASTRTWAEDIGYDPVKLFNKVGQVKFRSFYGISQWPVRSVSNRFADGPINWKLQHPPSTQHFGSFIWFFQPKETDQ